MIDYEGRKWLDVILRVRGSVLPRLLPRALIGGGIGALAAWAFEAHTVKLAPIAHTMIGVALGLLLVFRTNASYDRYWEGRRLLGGIVIRVRDLVRQAAGWAPGEAHAGARQRVRDLACGYFRAVSLTLRGEDDDGSLGKLLPDDARAAVLGSSARPQAVMAHLTRATDALRKEAGLSDVQLLAMDQNLTAMTDALAGCERILKTPVPFAYAQHIKLFVVLFCYTAPFTMSEAMGWYTPLAATLLCIALFGVDEIGVEIEDPFGRDANDLPLDAMATGLEKVTAAVVSA
ncbi:MAG: bestrophin family protein [Sandaracinaceae bacterium]|nr:bestrophin family protein [Sandaracinaceae bacterium]